MAKLVVATWNRMPTLGDNRGYKTRLKDLAKAVRLTDDMVRQENFEADGLIKAIFVAPEYLFAKEWGGVYKSGSVWMRGIRSLSETIHNQIHNELVALSKRYPRILIVPGTITWLPPVDENALIRAYQYYGVKAAASAGIPFDKTNGVSALLKSYFNLDDKGLAALKQNKAQFRQSLNEALADYIEDSDFARDQMLYKSGQTRKLADTVFGKMASSMMRNTMYVLLNGKERYVYDKHANYGECATGLFGNPKPAMGTVYLPGINSGTAEIEGLRFGFEVCMDHGLRTLGTLQRASKDRPDIHIIVSDCVDYEDANALVRNGGYVIHASTSLSETVVFQKNPARSNARSLGTDLAGGTKLLFWEIDIDAYDSFSLAGTFMDPQRPATRWAPVQVPKNPFRSGS
ncbi:MAG: hypothetical protein ACLGRW_10020 [Acidobacteriota bacterium]